MSPRSSLPDNVHAERGAIAQAKARHALATDVCSWRPGNGVVWLARTRYGVRAPHFLGSEDSTALQAPISCVGCFLHECARCCDASMMTGPGTHSHTRIECTRNAERCHCCRRCRCRGLCAEGAWRACAWSWRVRCDVKLQQQHFNMCRQTPGLQQNPPTGQGSVNGELPFQSGDCEGLP